MEKRERQIKDLVYYQWLLITGGANPSHCKQMIDNIMREIPIDEVDNVKQEVESKFRT